MEGATQADWQVRTCEPFGFAPVEAVSWQLAVINFCNRCGEKQGAFIISERQSSGIIIKEFWSCQQSERTSATAACSRTFYASRNVLHPLSLHVVVSRHNYSWSLQMWLGCGSTEFSIELKKVWIASGSQWLTRHIGPPAPQLRPGQVKARSCLRCADSRKNAWHESGISRLSLVTAIYILS